MSAPEVAHETPVSANTVATETTQALVALLGALWRVPSVVRLGVSSDRSQSDLWVMTRHERIDDTKWILRLEYEAQRQSPLPLRLHVVPLDRVDPSTVPAFETLFER
jgi:hypothetical protein